MLIRIINYTEKYARTAKASSCSTKKELIRYLWICLLERVQSDAFNPNFPRYYGLAPCEKAQYGTPNQGLRRVCC